MILPRDFISQWGKDEPLIRFRKKAVDALAIADEEKDFLAKAGLPASAAPELSFEAPKSSDLPTVAELYGQANKFQRYRVIGSDGAGNPIAIDEKRSGEVVCLDHEDKFARSLVNKTIAKLAESLLVYRDMIRDSHTGDDTWVDGKLPLQLRKELHKALRKIDSAAMKAGCFWPGETMVSDVPTDYPENLLRELKSPDAAARLKASKKLESELRNAGTEQRKTQFGSRKVTSPLIGVLDDPNPKVVHNAVVALAQIGRNYFKDDDAFDKLLPLARSEHPLTARWAIDAVINLRGEASLDDVLPLCTDQSMELREMVLHHFRSWLMTMRTATSESVQPATRKRLRRAALEALNDKETGVRATAAELLREVGEPTDIGALQTCMDKESYWLSEKRINDAIKALEDAK